jgi:hypothetical protein
MFAFSDVKCVYVFVFLFSDVFSVTLICWGREKNGILVGALGCLGDLKVYLCCCLRPLLEAFIGRNEESGATTGRWLTICIARSLLAPDEDSYTLLINTHHHQHREAGILVQYSPQLSLLSFLLVPFCFFSFREEKRESAGFIPCLERWHLQGDGSLASTANLKSFPSFGIAY